MRRKRYLRMRLYGSSLALALALAAPTVPAHLGSGGVVYAQGTGGDQQGGQHARAQHPAAPPLDQHHPLSTRPDAHCFTEDRDSPDPRGSAASLAGSQGG